MFDWIKQGYQKSAERARDDDAAIKRRVLDVAGLLPQPEWRELIVQSMYFQAIAPPDQPDQPSMEQVVNQAHEYGITAWFNLWRSQQGPEPVWRRLSNGQYERAS